MPDIGERKRLVAVVDRVGVEKNEKLSRRPLLVFVLRWLDREIPATRAMFVQCSVSIPQPAGWSQKAALRSGRATSAGRVFLVRFVSIVPCAKGNISFSV